MPFIPPATPLESTVGAATYSTPVAPAEAASPSTRSHRIGAAGLELFLGAFVVVPLLFQFWLVHLWHQLAPWNDLLLVASALCGVVWLGSSRTRSKPAFLAPMLLLTAAAVISVAVNRVPAAQAARGVGAMLPFMALGLLSVRLPRPRVEPFLRLMIAVGVAVAAYGMISYITFRVVNTGLLPTHYVPWPRTLWERIFMYPYQYASVPQLPSWRLLSTFNSEVYLGAWLTMLAPVCLAFSLEERRRAVRILGFVATAVMLVTLGWTYSRSAAAAIVVASAVFGLRVNPIGWLMVVPVVLAIPAFALPWDVHRFTDVAGTEGGRVASIKLAGEKLVSHPLVGSGPGTRGLADMNYAKVAYETGLIGVGAFVWLLWSLLSPVLRARPETRQGRLCWAITAGLTGAMIVGMAGEVWESPYTASYFWILAGLLANLQSADSADLPASGTLPTEIASA